jgi:hypothetical protein
MTRLFRTAPTLALPPDGGGDFVHISAVSNAELIIPSPIWGEGEGEGGGRHAP